MQGVPYHKFQSFSHRGCRLKSQKLFEVVGPAYVRGWPMLHQKPRGILFTPAIVGSANLLATDPGGNPRYSPFQTVILAEHSLKMANARKPDKENNRNKTKRKTRKYKESENERRQNKDGKKRERERERADLGGVKPPKFAFKPCWNRQRHTHRSCCFPLSFSVFFCWAWLGGRKAITASAHKTSPEDPLRWAGPGQARFQR